MEAYQLQMTRGEDGYKLVHLPSGGRVAVPFDPLYAAERAAAEAARAIDPPDELRCKYKSTRCLNLRTKKRNGELHNFCQIHRERANQNQRNSEQRKRLPKQETLQKGCNPRTLQWHEQEGDKSLWSSEGIKNLWGSSGEICNDEKQLRSGGLPRHLHLLEPLQGDDCSHLEPTYDELKETAMLLSIPDRNRE